MPMLDLDGFSLHYRIDGCDGPWLVFCNSLGADLTMWDAQAAALSSQFRVLRYDRRGHGASSAPPPPYTLADLAGDALTLMEALAIERAHYCGLSIGGLVAQWLAIHAPSRLHRVVVCASAARIGDAESWQARCAAVARQGLAPLRQATAKRWFGEVWRAQQPGIVDAILDRFQATSPDAYRGCCAALADADLRADIGRITLPLLTLAGADDPVCPPAQLQAIAAACAGQSRVLPGRHLLNVESADAFSAALRAFLS